MQLRTPQSFSPTAPIFLPMHRTPSQLEEQFSKSGPAIPIKARVGGIIPGIIPAALALVGILGDPDIRTPIPTRRAGPCLTSQPMQVTPSPSVSEHLLAKGV